MLSFKDGPCAGVLMPLIRRAPIMLRVVCDERGKWDALDQLDDEVRPNEVVHLYRLMGKPGSLCIRGSGRGKNRRPGGWFPVADYEWFRDGPPRDVLRDNVKWVEWCRENQTRFTPDWAKE